MGGSVSKKGSEADRLGRPGRGYGGDSGPGSPAHTHTHAHPFAGASPAGHGMYGGAAGAPGAGGVSPDFHAAIAPTTATGAPPSPYDDSHSIVPTVFRWELGGGAVYITGTFNNWSRKVPMVRSGNDFVYIAGLPRGKHAYKFIVDEEWRFAPDQPTVTDAAGNINNFIDLTNFNPDVDEGGPARRDSPVGAYGHDLPDEDEYTKEPYLLPPQLRHIALNAASPDPVDTMQLPTPNHVTLNHLYCFTEDHQILTNKGFMYLHELERCYDPSLLIAGYDHAAKELVYERCSALILNRATQQGIVEISTTNSDDKIPHELVAGVSLAVTHEHDMFVRRRRRRLNRHCCANGDRRHICSERPGTGEDFRLVKAGSLLSLDDSDTAQLLCAAAAGARASSFKGPDGLRRWWDEPACCTRLLQLYGFWLAQRGQCTLGHREAMDFLRVAVHDEPAALWLRQTLDSLQLRSGCDFSMHTASSDVGFAELRLTNAALVAAFQNTSLRGYSSASNVCGCCGSVCGPSSTAQPKKYKHADVRNASCFPGDLPWLAPSSAAAGPADDSHATERCSIGWCANWVWELGGAHVREIVTGLLRGGGANTRGERGLIVSCERVRDELVRLGLHAGFSPWAAAIARPFPASSLQDGGGWAVYFADGELATPTIHLGRHVRETDYAGRTWCVTVPSGKIVARRVFHQGGHMKISRPTIVGNCTAIKDNLMVQALTQRYRRKFVTTVFYTQMPMAGSLMAVPVAPGGMAADIAQRVNDATNAQGSLAGPSPPATDASATGSVQSGFEPSATGGGGPSGMQHGDSLTIATCGAGERTPLVTSAAPSPALRPLTIRATGESVPSPFLRACDPSYDATLAAGVSALSIRTSVVDAEQGSSRSLDTVSHKDGAVWSPLSLAEASPITPTLGALTERAMRESARPGIPVGNRPPRPQAASSRDSRADSVAKYAQAVAAAVAAQQNAYM